MHIMKTQDGQDSADRPHDTDSPKQTVDQYGLEISGGFRAEVLIEVVVHRINSCVKATEAWSLPHYEWS